MFYTAAIQDLKTLLGSRLSQSPSDLEIHGRSETHFPVVAPDAIAYVQSREEVIEVVKICAAHKCPVIGWGTGTSLEGHTAALRGGVSVDFSQMNRVLQINEEDMTVRVEPGLTRQALNEELRATGLFFPVDPGANASLGGMASTGASGTTTVRYGNMRANVLSLGVVLADGRFIETGNLAPKTSAGYDLTSLFVGSEGTLGLFTHLTLRLHPQPEAISAGIVAFADMNNAVKAVTQTIQMVCRWRGLNSLIPQLQRRLMTMLMQLCPICHIYCLNCMDQKMALPKAQRCLKRSVQNLVGRIINGPPKLKSETHYGPCATMHITLF